MTCCAHCNRTGPRGLGKWSDPVRSQMMHSANSLNRAYFSLARSLFGHDFQVLQRIVGCRSLRFFGASAGSKAHGHRQG